MKAKKENFREFLIRFPVQKRNVLRVLFNANTQALHQMGDLMVVKFARIQSFNPRIKNDVVCWILVSRVAVGRFGPHVTYSFPYLRK